jgi:hypothetical protein
MGEGFGSVGHKLLATVQTCFIRAGVDSVGL